MNPKYEQFQKSMRADVKLKIALEEYLRLEGSCGESDEKSVYKSYLQQRRRAAWEVLIREENLDGLQLFVDEKWLTKEDVKHCLDIAAKMQKKESTLWLLKYQWEVEHKEDSENLEIIYKSGTKCEISSVQCHNICEEIKQTLLSKLQNEIPSLGSAFPYLEWESNEKKQFRWGTDGTHLYYNEKELLALAESGFERLARRYLHTLFHCLYLHMLLPEENMHKNDWNLACDVVTEWTLDHSGWFLLERVEQKNREKIYLEIEKQGYQRDTKSCLKWISQLDEQQKENINKLFFADEHNYWYQAPRKEKSKTLEEGERLANTWGRARQAVTMQAGGEQFQKETRGGAGTDFYQIQKKKTYDYRKFLRQFAVCREEMQLDMESIDYIPYHYGLERYGNILLIEPLETTEVNRLEEFVIAIDTSGSCSGAIVKRFLEETYGILSARENFFRKMKVHIIQCDSMIQDHQVITCEEDWKKYQEHVQIQGLGGTDFTPVFRLVDQMLEKKEIRKLKGLMYFTDGDGIFPKKKPSYETAFVFLNQALEKQKIPDWAIRLNLDMKLD